jgi:hypothetical protein
VAACVFRCFGENKSILTRLIKKVEAHAGGGRGVKHRANLRANKSLLTGCTRSWKLVRLLGAPMCERPPPSEGQVEQTYWNAKQPESGLLTWSSRVVHALCTHFPPCFPPEDARAHSPCYYCPPTLAVNVKSIPRGRICILFRGP